MEAGEGGRALGRVDAAGRGAPGDGGRWRGGACCAWEIAWGRSGTMPRSGRRATASGSSQAVASGIAVGVRKGPTPPGSASIGAGPPRPRGRIVSDAFARKKVEGVE